MGTIAITGAAGGIGLATRERLETDGHRVIGIDVRDAEVIADLSTPAGREEMIAGVTDACAGVLDGLVAGAGIMDDFDGGNAGRVLAVNYFGAVATLAGLRPLLERGTDASAVAISSNSATAQSGGFGDLIELCLAGDEGAAIDAGGALHAMGCYPASKLALARWVRRQAGGADWIGSGIRLNAVAPGVIATPMTADSLEFILGLGDLFPVPIGRAGRAEEVAGLLAYLLSPEAGFFCGSVVFMDGGTDAAVRSDDWPAPRTHS